MPKYIIEYTYLAFGGEDIEGYEQDIIEIDAISPSQAIQKAELHTPFGSKKHEIINTIYEN